MKEETVVVNDSTPRAKQSTSTPNATMGRLGVAASVKYIYYCIYHDKIKVTVRGIANAVGLKSSRSGMRLLQTLIAKGYVYRDEGGDVKLSREVDGCGTKFDLV